MKIGKLSIGYREHDKYLWKKYLLPKAYISSKHKHDYFKFYYRWLNLFWCMPRKCECCGNYMTSKGGTHIWDFDGNKKVITVCENCLDNKVYVDKDGCAYYGYIAWNRETWDKELECD